MSLRLLDENVVQTVAYKCSITAAFNRSQIEDMKVFVAVKVRRLYVRQRRLSGGLDTPQLKGQIRSGLVDRLPDSRDSPIKSGVGIV
ncbi:hypothetical protein AFA91_13185 [Mycolicibacterium goodii]|uniref:Uncharacterized protein n=1 Tax=Mycolicibacterium goodii TaxID=134601 RepID=A0A0K0X5L4_MYCGD|nr:hypothetical protein AFA91_13185 [Mycolicibacterium goodii]